MISKKNLKLIKNLKKPIVLVPMAGDIIHHGHIRILKKSKKLGSVIVGLMTDLGLKSYKGSPLMSYKYRKEIISHLISVDLVIPLNGLEYVELCKIIRPNFFVHGSDWRSGPQKNVRDQLIKNQNNLKLNVKEFLYTRGISSSNLKKSKIK